MFARRFILLALLAAMAIGSGSGAQERTASTPDRRAIVIVPIHGEINDLTRDFLERCITLAQNQNAKAIVLDIQTPGGLVSSAIDISTRLKHLKDIRTVAWVNHEAISAGSLISLACNEIVVSARSKIGDCAAIMVGPQGMQSLGETERAKIDSYILAEFRDSASANGYPLPLAEAMVTLGPAVYRISNEAKGESKFVTANDLHLYDLTAPTGETKEKTSTDDTKPTEEAAKEAAPAPAADQGWKIDKKVLDKDHLLTMLGAEAIEYGFAKKQIDTDEELAAYLGGTTADIERQETNWSEDLVTLLTNPVLRVLLVVIMLMGLYVEMQSPGVGLPGAVALVAAAVLFGAPFLTGLANVIDLVLIAIGFVLLMIELFLIPGFGVTGFTGLALMFIGLLMTFVQSEPGPGVIPTLPGTWAMLETGLLSIVAAMAVTAVGFYFVTKHFGRIPIANRLVLTAGVTPGAASGSASPSTPRPPEVQVGQTGRVVMQLKPVGRAEFDGRLVDVVCTGRWIEPGKTVRITQVSGNYIVVEEA
ncbi:MAG: hypothetical protein GC162_17655 [Planctomycetes bacterium]|nr:hypothetical protein [Planctomycetota bacterium]